MSFSSSIRIHLQPCSIGSDLHQAHHVCVIPWVYSKLIRGLLSFSHMILHVMCLNSHWMQMSLRSLCLLCYESCLLSHNVSIYYMMELRTSLHVSILHPRNHSYWIGIPFLLGRFCINDVTAFIILFFIFELSSLVLQNKSHYCRQLCMRSFLQVKCICMVRSIS